MHVLIKIILTVILFLVGFLCLGLWPYIPGKYPGGVAISIALFGAFMYGIYRLWKTETTGTAWMNLDKVQATFRTEKWYNNNWIIFLCYLIWPLGIFLTIRKLLIVYGYYNVETKKFENPNVKTTASKQDQLENLRKLDIISQEEYLKKNEELHLEKNIEEKTSALKNALSAGVITEKEYYEKLNQIKPDKPQTIDICPVCKSKLIPGKNKCFECGIVLSQ